MRPRIRRDVWPASSSSPSEERTLEIGWPRFHLVIVEHHYAGELSDRDVGLLVGPTKGRGLGLQTSVFTGAFPDTDEDGWPQ